MSGLQFILLIFMLSMAWFLVFTLTPFFMTLAKKLNILDIPSHRKIHSQPIPRIGGLAVFCAFVIPFAVFYVMLCYHLNLSLLHIFRKHDWMGIFIGGLTVFAVGFVDDVRGLPPLFKLFCQTVGALCACLGGLLITQIYLPFWGTLPLYHFAYPFTILWFLLIINGFNLIDGLDGLVAITSFVCSFFLLVLCLQNDRFVLALPTVIITGATLGFFHFNMNPAKVFMGDSGSYFLGYNLAALALKASKISVNGGVNILVPAFIFALPIVDSMMAILRRLVRGQHIFCPDADHIHHCLLRRGLNQNEVLFVLCSITVITGFCGLLVNQLPDWASIFMLFGVVVAFSFWGKKVGYLDCFSESEICKRSNVWLKRFKLRIKLLELSLFAGKGQSTSKLTSILKEIFELIELDYAVLVVEFPPDFRNDIEVFRKNKQKIKPVGERGLISIRFPLYYRNLVYGELYIEKYMIASSYSPKFIFNVVNLISLIVVRKLRKISALEKVHHPKKSTFILIPNKYPAKC